MGNQTFETEQVWLDLMQESPLVGIFLLDQEGCLVQRIDGDPRLRDVVIEYQAGRVRELSLLEQKASRQPVAYPVAD